MFHQQKSQSPNRTTFQNQETTLLPNTHDQDSIAGLKDTIISLQYRIKTLQVQINGKMERQQCMTLLERKTNAAYVKKGFQEIYAKIQADRLRDESNFQKMQQEQKQKINDLKKKLKDVNNIRQGTDFGSPLAKDMTSFNFTENMTKKLNKVMIKPQQLYLESNQTMFSMLIDEIKQLKQKDSLVERLIQSKHKKTVSLNNEVCRKLQHLQNQLEQTIKQVYNIQSRVESGQSGEGKKLSKKSISKGDKQMQQQQQRTQPQNQEFEMIRIELLSKSMQVIQKQLAQKLNIKDVVPLIKQNVPVFEESLQQIKSYVEQNFESMRKILQNQSEINEQISKSNRVAWWHCFEKLQFQQSQRSSSTSNLGYILFSKQIMNIIPECLTVQKDQEHSLKILTKGWYLIQVYELDSQAMSEQSQREKQDELLWIQINNSLKQPIRNRKLLNLAAQTEIKFITEKDDLFVKVQKL